MITFTPCSFDVFQGILEQNQNLTLRSASKHSTLIMDLIDKAQFEVSQHLDFSGIKFSKLVQLLRREIDYAENESARIIGYLNKNNQDVLTQEGRFIVVKISDPSVFDNVYDDEYEYLVIDTHLEYLLGKKEMPTAMAFGSKVVDQLGNEKFEFTLAHSHVEWSDFCRTVKEIPSLAFSLTASYTAMCSGN
jgi:hypothetical protein